MRATTPLLVSLVVMAAVAPVTLAHAQAFPDSKLFRFGDYGVLIEPDPQPLYATVRTAIKASVSDTRSGTYTDDMELNVTFSTDGVAPMTVDLSTEMPNSPYRIQYVTFPKSANYTMVTLGSNSEGSWNNTTSITVYPNLPFRIEPDQNKPDPYTNEPYELAVYVINRSTSQPCECLRDLSMRIEHWTDDHKTMLGRNDTNMAHTSIGTFTWTDDFREPGMYHLLFGSRSAGFGYDTFPLFHMYANKRPPDLATTSGDSPSVAWPLVALVLIVVAAFAHQRRR